MISEYDAQKSARRHHVGCLADLSSSSPGGRLSLPWGVFSERAKVVDEKGKNEQHERAYLNAHTRRPEVKKQRPEKQVAKNSCKDPANCVRIHAIA